MNTPPKIVHESARPAHQTMTTLRAKVILTGDATVGKTALCKLAASNSADYPKNYVLTTAIELSTKMMKVEDCAVPTQVELMLLDTPGSSMSTQRDVGQKLWESANMVAVVYDIGSRESFRSCAKWKRRAQDARSGSETHGVARPMQGVLIANKADYREAGIDRAEVSQAEGKAFAESIGLAYFEVSAERGQDCDKPWQYLANAFAALYESDLAKTDAML